jgi:hypothetical protein
MWGHTSAVHGRVMRPTTYVNARFQHLHCYLSVGVFTFSLTSLYTSAVFFGKRKAGYILYGLRNWRGSRREPGVPGLHTRSPSLQLTGCPSA